MMKELCPEFQPIGWSTFNDELDDMFSAMVKKIAAVLDFNKIAESEDGWFSIGHDLWTSLTSDGVLGSCLKFIGKDMCEETITTVLTKHNGSHSGAEVAKALETVYQERYKVSVKSDAVYVASDTAR